MVLSTLSHLFRPVSSCPPFETVSQEGYNVNTKGTQLTGLAEPRDGVTLSPPVSEGHFLSTYASGSISTGTSVSKLKTGFHGNVFFGGFQHTVTEQQVCAFIHAWEHDNRWLSHDQMMNQSYEVVVPEVCRL